MKKWILLIIIALLLVIAAILAFAKCDNGTSLETTASGTGYTQESDEELPIDPVTESSETAGESNGTSAEGSEPEGSVETGAGDTSQTTEAGTGNTEESGTSTTSTELEGADYTDF